MSEPVLTTGIVEIDRLVGGVPPGDNIVWEVDSGAPIDQFIAAYLAAGEAQSATIAYISFNRSPQTISRAWSDNPAGADASETAGSQERGTPNGQGERHRHNDGE